MPRVSVVMSSYNHGKFIGQAIQSVLDQTYTDLELVIFENGSKDNSLQVISSFTDPRIKVHAVPTNIGGTAGMNAAIAHSSGDYIALLNSDDFYLPDKLSKQVTLLDQRPELGAVFALCRVVNEQGLVHPDTHRQMIFSTHLTDRTSYLRYFFFEGNCICHPTAVIRRTTFEHIGLFDIRFRRLPDFDYWIRLFISYDIIVVDEELAVHRFLDDESNESGARTEVWAAARWEYTQILQHYRDIDEILFKDIFTDKLDLQHLHGLHRIVQLGHIAVNTSHISAHAFGLTLLHEAVTEHLSGITVDILQHYASILDIYGVTTKHNLEIQLQSLSQQLVQIQAELVAIKGSKSWRMTSWARLLVSSVKRYLANLQFYHI